MTRSPEGTQSFSSWYLVAFAWPQVISAHLCSPGKVNERCGPKEPRRHDWRRRGWRRLSPCHKRVGARAPRRRLGKGASKTNHKAPRMDGTGYSSSHGLRGCAGRHSQCLWPLGAKARGAKREAKRGRPTGLPARRVHHKNGGKGSPAPSPVAQVNKYTTGFWSTERAEGK